MRMMASATPPPINNVPPTEAAIIIGVALNPSETLSHRLSICALILINSTLILVTDVYLSTATQKALYKDSASE